MNDLAFSVLSVCSVVSFLEELLEGCRCAWM